MPSIVTNFKFKSNAPNFERDQVKKKSDLKKAGFTDYDMGHIVYCMQDNKHYTFATNKNKSTGELIWDEETGWFSVFKAGGAGSGEDGENANGAYRTVYAFKSSKEQPEKPKGWVWDLIKQTAVHPQLNEDTMQAPDGWTLDDSSLETPIWMSIGTFNVNFPEEENWTMPIRISGEDGRPGTDGSKLEFIYTRYYDDSETPGYPDNNPNVDDYKPNPWFDSTGQPHAWTDNPQGVSQTMQCEWMCQRWKADHNQDGTQEWGQWIGPVLWSKWGVMGKDGDGVEYIYNVTATNEPPKLPTQTSEFIETDISRNEDGKVFQEDEYIPNGRFTINGQEEYIEGWTDNPSNTTPEEPFEWVSIRKWRRDTDKWQAFSDPVLWAHYGKEGFTSFVFTRSNTQPATPVDGDKTSYEYPIPVDPNKKVEWSDGIPASDKDGNTNAIIWMSKKSFFNEAADSTRPWSQPMQMSDTADFDVEFNESEEFPGPPGPPGQPNDQNGWTDTATENTVWMATSTCKNGKWSEWSIVKIKGERGDDGTSVNILGRYGTYEELERARIEKTLNNGNTDHNPPQVGDAYIVSVVNVTKDGDWIKQTTNVDADGNFVSCTPPTNLNAEYKMYGVLFTWDGDSWVFLGKFQGDAAYVHIKYSPNPDVLNSTANGGEGIENFPTNDLWEVPMKNGRMAKYMGMYSDSELQDSIDVNKYKWTKFVGEDGFGYEYIYMLSKTDDAPDIANERDADGNLPSDYQTLDHVPVMPDGWQENNPNYKWWTDEPVGPNEDYPYEWMCWRTWQQGLDEWTDWKGSKATGKAALYAVWSESGFTSFAFTRTNSDLSGWDMSNVTGSYKNPLPTMKDADNIIDGDDIPGHTEFNGETIIWEDSVPAPSAGNPYEVVWMTSAKFTLKMDGMNDHPVWSKPRAMSDTSDMDVDWCPWDETTNPAITDPGNPDTRTDIWWESPYVGKSNDGKTEWPAREVDGEVVPYDPVWMATRKLKNGEPIEGESWVITRVKGEKGESGTDGTSVKIKGAYDTLADLKAAWLGEDGAEATMSADGQWISNDGTLYGDNPPLEYDAYTINYFDKEHTRVCGDLYVYTPSAYDASADDPLMSKWTNVGKFKGDPGLPSFTHIKYSNNPKVLEKPVAPTTNGTIELENYYKALDEYNKAVGEIYENPVIDVEDGGVTYKVSMKYMGVYSDNTLEDSDKASDYSWSKFGGEDGFSYEYIYMRTKTEDAPNVPADSGPEDDYKPVKPENWTEPWWTDNMTGVGIEYKYEWMCYRKKYTNNKGVYGWGAWIGDKETGKAALVNYYSEKEYTTMYSLNVDPTVIKMDKMGGYSTNILNVDTITKNGDTILSHGIPEGYKITCNFKKTDGNTFNGELATGNELNFNIEGANSAIDIKLLDKDGDIIDSETIPVLKDEANITTDLTNDSYAISCDNFGQPVNTAEVASTEFRMYYGLDNVTLSEASVTPTGLSTITSSSTTASSKAYGSFDVSIKLSENKKEAIVSVTNIDDSAPLAINLSIEGKTIINGNVYSGKTNFIVNKIQPGGKTPTLYQLIPTAGSITKNKDNERIPSSVGVKLIKIQGATDIDDAKTEQLTEIPDGMFINVYKDFTIIKESPYPPYPAGTELSKVSISTADISTALEFKLCNDTGEIHDIYIPVLNEGQDGITPTIYQIIPSVSTIKLAQNATGDYSPSSESVTVNFQRIIGNQVTTLPFSSTPAGFSWYYNIDFANYWEQITGTTGTISVSTIKPEKMITIEFRQGSTVIDRVMIPIVSNGQDGETTTIYSLNPSTKTIKVADEVATPNKVNATVLVKFGENIEPVEDSDARPMYAAVVEGSVKRYINKSGIVTGDTFNENSPSMSGSGKKLEKLPYGTQITVPTDSKYTAIEIYLYLKDGSKYTMIDKESIPILRDGTNGKDGIGKDGADGKTSAVANLTNDMLAVSCDDNGYPYDSNGDATDSEITAGNTTMQLFYGTTPLENITVSCSKGHTGINTSVNGNTVTVKMRYNAADVTNLTITGTGVTSDDTSITLSKTLKVSKIKKGNKGDKGDTVVGEKGKPGALARNLGKWSDLADGTKILSGNDDELYIDFVFDDDEENPIAYQCIKTHNKNTTIYPLNNTTYWLKSETFKFVSTNLLNADQIVAEVIQNNKSIVTDVVGDAGKWVGQETNANNSSEKIYTKVVTEGGIIEFYYSKASSKPDVSDSSWKKAVDIGYDFNNGECGMLRFYGQDGSVLYNLGPKGLVAEDLKSPSYKEAVYYTGGNFFDEGDGWLYDTIFGNEVIYGTTEIIPYNLNSPSDDLSSIESGEREDYYDKGKPSLNNFKYYTATYSKATIGGRPWNRDRLYKYKYIYGNIGTFTAQWSNIFYVMLPDEETQVKFSGSVNIPIPNNPSESITCGPNTIGFVGKSSSCSDLIFDKIMLNFGGNSFGYLSTPKRMVDIFIPTATDIWDLYNSGDVSPVGNICTGSYGVDTNYPLKVLSDGHISYNNDCSWVDIIKQLADGNIPSNISINIEGSSSLWDSTKCKTSVQNALKIAGKIFNQLAGNSNSSSGSYSVISIGTRSSYIFQGMARMAYYANPSGTYPELMLGIAFFNLLSSAVMGEENLTSQMGYLFPGNAQISYNASTKTFTHSDISNPSINMRDLYNSSAVTYSTSGNYLLGTDQKIGDFTSVYTLVNNPEKLKGYIFLSPKTTDIGSNNRISGGNNNAYCVYAISNSPYDTISIKCKPIDAYAGLIPYNGLYDGLKALTHGNSITCDAVNTWLAAERY